jgi:hypothetical protein
MVTIKKKEKNLEKMWTKYRIVDGHSGKQGRGLSKTKNRTTI